MTCKKTLITIGSLTCCKQHSSFLFGDSHILLGSVTNNLVKKVAITTYSQHTTVTVFMYLLFCFPYIYIFDHNLYFCQLPDNCTKLWVASYKLKVKSCVSFVPTFPPFMATCSFQRLALQTCIQQKSFSCKKVKKKTYWKLMKTIVKSQLNNSRRGKTEHHKLKLCFLIPGGWLHIWKGWGCSSSHLGV